MSQPVPEKESSQTWHKTFAMEANHHIEPEDKKIFFADFQSGPWYGMK